MAHPHFHWPIDTDMEHQKRILRLTLSAIAAGVLFTDGCVLPHAQLPEPVAFGEVSPLRYCPGDTITAAFDIAAESACVSRPGMDCAALAPTIAISGSPAAFPAQSFNAFAGHLSFATTEPRVDVSFLPTPDPFAVFYPTIRDGMPATGFRSIKGTTRTAERIDGEIARVLYHYGLCDGSTPGYASAAVGDEPGLSPNLRMKRLCNTSAVPIVATITGASGDFVRELGVGQCFELSEPGIPAGTDIARSVGVRSQAIDPTAQCSAVQGATPPQTLTTRAFFGCGN